MRISSITASLATCSLSFLAVQAAPLNTTQTLSDAPSPSLTTSPEASQIATIFPFSALNLDTVQYFDDWNLARKGHEYASAGPLQKRSVKRSGVSFLHNHDLMNGYAKVPKFILDKYPTLAEKGVKVGMEVVEMETLYWPRECACVEMMDGRVEYHIPTRLVTGCVVGAEC